MDSETVHTRNFHMFCIGVNGLCVRLSAWHSLATGLLQVETQLQNCASMRGSAGSAPDVRHQASQQVTCVSIPKSQSVLLILYGGLHKYQLSWRNGMNSLAVCMRSMVRNLEPCTFLQSVSFAYIRTYSRIYSFHMHTYGLVLVCTRSYAYIPRYTYVIHV